MVDEDVKEALFWLIGQTKIGHILKTYKNCCGRCCKSYFYLLNIYKFVIFFCSTFFLFSLQTTAGCHSIIVISASHFQNVTDDLLSKIWPKLLQELLVNELQDQATKKNERNSSMTNKTT